MTFRMANRGEAYPKKLATKIDRISLCRCFCFSTVPVYRYVVGGKDRRLE